MRTFQTNLYKLKLSIIDDVNLHAMSNVAFEDLATPSVFDATHQYVPASCSFLFCIARKKKRDPSGKRIRCDEASSGAVATS